MHVALKLTDVSHRFARHWALAHVTVSIDEGQAVLLTGANGAGKTTLLRIMATALRPSRGQVSLFGQDSVAGRAHIRRRVALMSHQHFMYEALSGRENLHMVCRLARPWAHDRVSGLLTEVGLSRTADLPLAQFSAGMKRRLALARVRLLEPDVVLLDEPFGQLDPAGVELMHDVIDTWREDGKTVVICTHDVDRGMTLCGRHLHLDSATGLCERTGKKAS